MAEYQTELENLQFSYQVSAIEINPINCERKARPAEKFNFPSKTMRFAKIGEEVFERQTEITCEEFRLYVVVVFHTFVDSGLCRLSIREICDIYRWDYQNTYRRYKILRKDFSPDEFINLEPKLKNRLRKMKTPWLEKTKKGIRPLVGIKGVKITPVEQDESVKITPEECKNYTLNGEKSVKITPPLIPFKEPLKKEPLKSPLSESGSENSTGRKSRFSQAECLLYVTKLKTGGAEIKNPHAYAMTLYNSGDSDAFIEADLYPETEEKTPETPLDDEIKANCPRCFGSGMEFVYEMDGSYRVRPGCKHEPLVEGEYLYKWRQENEFAE